MEFKLMDAATYRTLDADAFEKRRAEVIAELDNADSKVSFKDLNAEVAVIEQETQRRNAAVSLRNATLSAVKGGSGKVTEVHENNPTVAVTRNEDPFDTEDYNRAFMEFVTRGKKMPAGLVQPGTRPANVREDVFTQTSDVPNFIPTTLANTIIQKMSEYGTIWPKSTKMNIQGGLEIQARTPAKHR